MSMCAMTHDLYVSTNESVCHDSFFVCLTHEWIVKTRSRWHVCLTDEWVSECAMCVVHVCDMTHPYLQQDSFICVADLTDISFLCEIHMCDTHNRTLYWRFAVRDIHVTRINENRAMRRDSFMSVLSRIPKGDWSQSYVVHVRDIPNLYVWHT